MDSSGSRATATPRKATSEMSREQSFEPTMESMEPDSYQVSSRIFEVFKDSGLQDQLDNGWGKVWHDASLRSASPPSAGLKEDEEFSQPPSRQSPKASSPSSSRKNREKGVHKSRKSKRPMSGHGHVKQEHDQEDEGMETIPAAVQGPGEPYSPSRDSQTTESSEDRVTSDYRLKGHGYGSREYMNELDSELDALRKHLLQRAAAPRSFQ